MDPKQLPDEMAHITGRDESLFAHLFQVFQAALDGL